MKKRDENPQQVPHPTTDKKKHELFELSDELLAELTGGANVSVSVIDADATCGSYNF